MTSKLREWIFETSKFASAVVTFWLLSFVPFELKFTNGKLLEMLIEAVVASTLAFVFWGFVVGRPTVELHWRTAETYQPESGRPTLAPNQSVNVQIHVTGETWMCKAIRKCTEGRQCELELDFRPYGSHLVVIQTRRNTPARLNATGTGVIFTGLSARSGFQAVSEIQIVRDGAFTVSNPMELEITQRWSPPLARCCPKLLKVKAGVDGFHLRGR
ncbi:hypothetical protein MSP7336_01485 [Mycobacterium shimoidei]|uniref:Uncharacterized protein n=1 Tax=Mycobacterium shimoidei TaxID=29313 RepID=A0A375YWL1_MYCSH|nr:hypothetical protein [Mycobacterium shimoidei]SRX93249.1 hypothetical protein MSP7336_01485 [Mycobacterium shimoidei]